MKEQTDKGLLSNWRANLNGNQVSLQRVFILPLLMIVCILFYYFGELVNWAAWDALRINFFYGIHDTHRLLFLVPIIYSAYVYGIRATIIITVLTLMAFLPRAIFISPYPDPVLRMVIFTIIAGTIGCLVALLRKQTIRGNRLESQLKGEENKLFETLEQMKDGILIVGSDYSVKYMNSSMKRDFGQGDNLFCYQLMKKSGVSCQETCRLKDVIAGNAERWKCELPDGRIYEVQASPYINSEGLMCQLTSFRKVQIQIKYKRVVNTRLPGKVL